MSLELDQVLAIAHLARLATTDEEVNRYAVELSRILSIAEQLQVVDVADIQPMAHPLDEVQRMRPDTVTEPDQRDLLMAGAPLSERGLFLVPRVIE